MQNCRRKEKKKKTQARSDQKQLRQIMTNPQSLVRKGLRRRKSCPDTAPPPSTLPSPPNNKSPINPVSGTRTDTPFSTDFFPKKCSFSLASVENDIFMWAWELRGCFKENWKVLSEWLQLFTDWPRIQSLHQECVTVRALTICPSTCNGTLRVSFILFLRSHFGGLWTKIKRHSLSRCPTNEVTPEAKTFAHSRWGKNKQNPDFKSYFQLCSHSGQKF